MRNKFETISAGDVQIRRLSLPLLSSLAFQGLSSGHKEERLPFRNPRSPLKHPVKVMSRCSRLVRASSSRAPFTTSTRAFDKQKQTSWQRALEPGRVPAYDESLKFLAADASAKKAQLAELKKSKSADQKSIEQLEVKSEVNDPEVRWNFRHGKGLDRFTWSEQAKVDRDFDHSRLFKTRVSVPARSAMAQRRPSGQACEPSEAQYTRVYISFPNFG